MNPDAVTIRGRVLADNACFFGESTVIPANAKRNFNSIVGDVKRLQSIFELPDEAIPDYEKTVREITTANLVVRPNSVPKKVCTLFTMVPRNKNLSPLFRRIPEHKR